MLTGTSNPVPRGPHHARVTARPVVRLFFRKYPYTLADANGTGQDAGWIEGRIRFRVLQRRDNRLYMSAESEVEASNGIAIVFDRDIGVRVFDTDYFPQFLPENTENNLLSLTERLKDLGYIANNSGVDTLRVVSDALPDFHQYERGLQALSNGSRTTEPLRPPEVQIKELLNAAMTFQFDRSLLPTGIDNRDIAYHFALTGLENRPSNAANVLLYDEVRTSHAHMTRRLLPAAEDPAHPYSYQMPTADPRDREHHQVSPIVSSVTCLSLVRFESLASDVPHAERPLLDDRRSAIGPVVAVGGGQSIRVALRRLNISNAAQLDVRVRLRGVDVSPQTLSVVCDPAPPSSHPMGNRIPLPSQNLVNLTIAPHETFGAPAPAWADARSDPAYDVEILYQENVIHRLKVYVIPIQRIPLHVHFVTVRYSGIMAPQGEICDVDRRRLPAFTNVIPYVNAIWAAACIQFEFDAAANTHFTSIDVTDRAGAFLLIPLGDNSANNDLRQLHRNSFIADAINIYVVHVIATEDTVPSDTPGSPGVPIVNWNIAAATYAPHPLSNAPSNRSPMPCILVPEGTLRDAHSAQPNWSANNFRSEWLTQPHPDLFLARALAHELGHFFQLLHPFEQTLQTSSTHTPGIDDNLRSSMRCLMHYELQGGDFIPTYDDFFDASNHPSSSDNPYLYQHGCFTAQRYAREYSRSHIVPGSDVDASP